MIFESIFVFDDFEEDGTAVYHKSPRIRRGVDCNSNNKCKAG